MNNNLVEARNLSIQSKAGNVLVSNISFEIKKGEFLGVVGESGSGKTLTAKTIADLLPEGLSWKADTLEAFGEGYANITKKQRRFMVGRDIGFVPQNTVFYLHPMIKIKNQIADGYMLYFKKKKNEGLDRAAGLLKKVGFEDPKRVLNSYPWQLSGGMRQRVNIAMALMNDPKLIIADEPTTALDCTVQKQVTDLFQQINQESGVTILLISHDLGLVKHYCSRILVMYAGQILEQGEAKELFSSPRHPYTKSLIKVIPSLNIKKGERLSEIPGYVPDTGRNRTGCIYLERCAYKTEECEKQVEERTVNETHSYKCNLNS